MSLDLTPLSGGVWWRNMTRVRIVKLYKDYNIGDIVEVSPNIAHGLIDCGVAILSKDMVSTDYYAKAVKTPVKRRRRRNG